MKLDKCSAIKTKKEQSTLNWLCFFFREVSQDLTSGFIKRENPSLCRGLKQKFRLIEKAWFPLIKPPVLLFKNNKLMMKLVELSVQEGKILKGKYVAGMVSSITKKKKSLLDRTTLGICRNNSLASFKKKKNKQQTNHDVCHKLPNQTGQSVTFKFVLLKEFITGIVPEKLP